MKPYSAMFICFCAKNIYKIFASVQVLATIQPGLARLGGLNKTISEKPARKKS